MKRLVIKTIFEMCAKCVFFTTLIGIIIGVIGYINKWDTAIAYSNAFFLAGCLAIIAGTSSRLGAGAEWSTFQVLYAESFRKMNAAEKANFIIDASSSVSLLILGVVTGSLLILISWLVTKLF